MSSSLRETVMSFMVFLPRLRLGPSKPRNDSTFNPVGLIPESVAGVKSRPRLDSKGYCAPSMTHPVAEVWRGLGADSFKGALPNAAHS